MVVQAALRLKFGLGSGGRSSADADQLRLAARLFHVVIQRPLCVVESRLSRCVIRLYAGLVAARVADTLNHRLLFLVYGQVINYLLGFLRLSARLIGLFLQLIL